MTMAELSDEVLLAENEALRAKIADLEKIVGSQQNEMVSRMLHTSSRFQVQMLLRSSTADILLRLNRLEMAFDNATSIHREPQPGNFKLFFNSLFFKESHNPLPPRSSQSAYAISNGQSTPKASTMSKSLYVPSNSGKMHEDVSSKSDLQR